LILADKKARTKAGARIGTSLKSLKKMYPRLDRGPDSWTGLKVYRVADGVKNDGSLSLYFEVEGGKVVGISLQPSIFFNDFYSVSDRICGGP
jgi:hypothetical protein